MQKSKIATFAIIISIAMQLALLPVDASEMPPLHRSLRGDGTLALYRPDKNERITVKYRNKDGIYYGTALDDIAHFFRCRLTNEAHPIDPDLIEMLDSIEDHFGGREISLISTYRSPLRNSIMKRQGRRVARQSLHMFGRAVDIEVRSVPSPVVRNFAYSLKQGGVGYYGKRRFVHVDTGPIRTWGWAPAGTARGKPAVANK